MEESDHGESKEQACRRRQEMQWLELVGFGREATSFSHFVLRVLREKFQGQNYFGVA
jgi:hypothetical protein